MHIMKKNIISLIILVAFFIFNSNDVFSQCKSFAKKICRLELDPYIHDGNYNAAILTEGEDAELYKTFYAGQQYRIAICGSETLPQVQFMVLDLSRNILYNSKQNNYKNTWDFELESSQQLIIFVKVQESETPTDELEILSGCVSIMFGILDQ